MEIKEAKTIRNSQEKQRREDKKFKNKTKHY